YFVNDEIVLSTTRSGHLGDYQTGNHHILDFSSLTPQWDERRAEKYFCAPTKSPGRKAGDTRRRRVNRYDACQRFRSRGKIAACPRPVGRGSGSCRRYALCTRLTPDQVVLLSPPLKAGET